MSSRGWAFGYLGGGILLASTSRWSLLHDAFGLGKGLAVRLCLLSAALWWAGFTVIPFVRLREPSRRRRGTGAEGGLVRQQLRPARQRRCSDMRELPDDADVPGRLPVLQRRHPDGDLRRRRRTARSSSASDPGADRDDPAGAVRGLRRRAAASAGSPRAYGAYRAILAGLVVWMADRDRRRCFLPAQQIVRCSWRSASRSASCSAAPRRCPARSSAS